MPKRILPDDDDEVEIVSSSFDIPRVGPAAGGSSSNPYILDFNSPPKPKAKNRKPRAQKASPAILPAGPSFAAFDPHPYSYPAKLSPPMSQNRPISKETPTQPPAKKQRKKKADPDAPVPEKRGAIFKKACPKNILDRVDRVMSQRYGQTRPITILLMCCS
jgi:hypothetical protein